jgi:hypothetical protein
MQTNSFPAFFDQGLVPMNDAELLTTYGGSFGSLLLDAAAFLISPGLGFFHLGVKAGYEAAANS